MKLLPLRSLADGARDDLGTGAGYRADGCLQVIVQALRDQPGEGWPLVQTALSNRVVGNRNGALRVLEAWPRDRWPGEVEEVLVSAMWREPRSDVRERMRALLHAGRMQA
jgi:hypothetical protein